MEEKRIVYNEMDIEKHKEKCAVSIHYLRTLINDIEKELDELESELKYGL